MSASDGRKSDHKKNAPDPGAHKPNTNKNQNTVPALDPQVAAFYGDRLKNAPLCPPSLEEARANADATFHDRYRCTDGRIDDERFVPVKRTEDMLLPSLTGPLSSLSAFSDTPHTIPARLYVPFPPGENRSRSQNEKAPDRCAPDAENRQPLPLMLYFHGGGFIMHNIASHDTLCRALADRCGCLVLSVGYRLAPEHPYPACIADGFSALMWAFEHAAKLGGDPHKLILAGDSAGATISASLNLMLRDLRRKTAASTAETLAIAAADRPHTAQRTQLPQQSMPRQALPEISLQILCYGSMGCIPAEESDSVQLFGSGGYVLPKPMMDWCMSLYAPNSVSPNAGGTSAALSEPFSGFMQDPYLNPGQAADLTDLPPTLSITTECDPLRDDGEAFASRLSAAGNQVIQYRAPGMMHGFLLYWHKFDRTAEVFDLMADIIRKI